MFLRHSSGGPYHKTLKLHTGRENANSQCTCKVVEHVDNYKYLGLLLDNKLKWTNNIIHKNEIRKLMLYFYQFRECLIFKVLRSVCCAYLQSLLEGGLLRGGGGYIYNCAGAVTDNAKMNIKSCSIKMLNIRQVNFFVNWIFLIKELFVKILLVFMYKNSDCLFNPVTLAHNSSFFTAVGIIMSTFTKSLTCTNSYYLTHIT